MYCRYLLADLNSTKFKENGLGPEKENLITEFVFLDIVIFIKLLACDELLPQLVPMLESAGVAEVIQQYTNSKYVQCFQIMPVLFTNFLYYFLKRRTITQTNAYLINLMIGYK